MDHPARSETRLRRRPAPELLVAYRTINRFCSELVRLPNESDQPLELVELRVQIDPARLLGAQKLGRLGLARTQLIVGDGPLRELALQTPLLELIPPSLSRVGDRGL